MLTIKAYRKQFLAELRSAFERPGMYGGDARGAEQYFRIRLGDLCTIGDRAGALESAMKSLESSGLWCATGVAGALDHQIERRKGIRQRFQMVNETASVYAEIAHRLGYLLLNRLLNADEWRSLRGGEAAILRRRRATRPTDLVAAYGPPSFSTLGSYTRTLCYASVELAEPWICFDASVVSEIFNGPTSSRLRTGTFDWLDPGGLDDPPLRTIRFRTPTSHEMMFTPYGRWALKLRA